MASFEELLINTYRLYPVLYDMSLKEYKNEKLKLNAWEKIAEEMSIMGYCFQVDEIKAKVKNLKDTYGRCKKKNDAAIKSGAPASSTPTWEFWSLLTWLDDYRKRRRTVTNVASCSLTSIEESCPSPRPSTPSETCSTSSGGASTISLEESLALDIPVASSNIDFNPGSSSTLATCLTTPAKSNALKKTKKRKADEMSPYQSRLIGCLEALQNSSTESPTKQNTIANDEYDYFGKSVAEQIRKLPTPFCRARAKKEILFNLEFAEQP